MNELSTFRPRRRKSLETSQGVSWVDCPTEPLRMGCALEWVAGLRAGCMVPLPQFPTCRMRSLDECQEQVAEPLAPTAQEVILSRAIQFAGQETARLSSHLSF